MRDDDVTVSQAAAMLGIDRANVRWLIHRGRLPARRVGSVYILRRDDVAAHAVDMRGRQRPGPKPTRAREGPSALRQAQGIAPTD